MQSILSNPIFNITLPSMSRFMKQSLYREEFRLKFTHFLPGGCGGAVVKALRYKPEGRGFDS
jgi:hypothetical protein